MLLISCGWMPELFANISAYTGQRSHVKKKKNYKPIISVMLKLRNCFMLTCCSLYCCCLFLNSGDETQITSGVGIPRARPLVFLIVCL